MSSAPTDTERISGPRLGPLGWARWTWRQLTSMRTALLLLMLLAVAAVPGSIWPQRSVDPVAVRGYLDEHPELGPWLDRLGLFDVYSSPWFASIYLLLMVSLVGCILPRTRQHLTALRQPPPAVPRRPERLPAHRHTVVVADPAELEQRAREVLRGHRYRLRAPDAERPGATDAGAREVAAEGGYLRETGNLVFHISLLAIIVSVAAGHLWGWRGEVILAEGQTFTSSAGRYDTIQTGPWVGEEAIAPFVLRLDDLEVSFETEAGGAQFGAPRVFRADVTTSDEPGEPQRARTLEVNHPLQFGGTSVYLLGNGYAPVVTVRDPEGQVLYSQATPFLPRDNNYLSTGAVKVPAAEPQLGFFGAFLPTVVFDDRGPGSSFPGLADPALALGVYEGELFPDGRPESVYALDVSSLTQVTTDEGEASRILLRPGQSADLPGGRGSVTLDGVARWAGLVARHDPGRLPALISASVMLLALVAMLVVRRRRLFVRVHADPQGRPGHTGLTVAGLAKGADPGLQARVDQLLDEIADHRGRADDEEQV